MKDIQIGPIKPAGEPRANEKTVRKEKGVDSAFDREFHSALSKTNEVKARNNDLTGGKVDSRSIQQQMKADTEDFQKLMEAKNGFQKIFHEINAKKSQE